jgi:hypothetical protein
MKQTVFFLLIALFFACKDGEQKGIEDTITTVDSPPKGKWNGEYIKVTDSLAEENKPKKKSRGSEFFNMGTVEVNVDTMEFSIDLFEQRSNHVTIGENSLSIRIKSAQRDFLSIHLKKPNIINNYAGTYKIDPDGTKSTSSAIDFSRLSLKNTMQLTMVSGSTTVESFSPRLGKLVLKAKGVFEDADGNAKSGVVYVNMRFESVVSTYNPNS